MFEQKSTQANPPQPQANKEGGPPSNLPTGPAEQSPKEPEDILADIDIEKDSVQKPAQSSDLGIRPTVPELPKPKIEAKEPFIKKYQKALVIVVLVVVGGVVLGVGGWYAYNRFITPSSQLPAQVDQLPVNQNINAGQPVVNQNINFNQPVVNQNINQPKPPIDTDRDGISDEEEALYGTDSTKVDTDEDGLTDRDEIKVFKTDPTNSDSDGDGFPDGEEVRNGYNPKGGGRLLKIE